MRDFTWRKSAASGAGNDCVEVRGDLGALRDSKRPGGVVELPPGRLALLVALARRS